MRGNYEFRVPKTIYSYTHVYLFVEQTIIVTGGAVTIV